MFDDVEDCFRESASLWLGEPKGKQNELQRKP